MWEMFEVQFAEQKLKQLNEAMRDLTSFNL
jgi:hypothetical protein